MAYSKLTIYNLALSSLLLAKQVTEIETDTSNEVKVLNLHWDVALESTLKDLDLDSLSTRVTLELIEELPNDKFWNYVYAYPDNCALLRRLDSGALTDTNASLIDKHVRVLDGEKVIYTNDTNSVAEIIPLDLPISAVPGMACMAIAYKLAYLSAPLITGKGAQKLRDELMKQYVIAKNEAQEDDVKENATYQSDESVSEWVATRIS
jgi:antitoxin (DNA-binding transcriptional repressor) of toxin-antitoxin stability system